MGRILAIDYGSKRTGIAVTDPLRLIANGLTTVDTKELEGFLSNYILAENVDIIVVGLPKTLQNEPADIARYINPFVGRLKHNYPNIKIEMVDERFTSKMAFQTMIDSGISRKARQNKSLIDQISATIILQHYMEFNP